MTLNELKTLNEALRAVGGILSIAGDLREFGNNLLGKIGVDQGGEAAGILEGLAIKEALSVMVPEATMGQFIAAAASMAKALKGEIDGDAEV